MNNPLVSVVLSTYNDERYIAETIKSVLAQTYTNFEFIIWNDGSTDRTEEIIKSFEDPRIRYFYHENVGLGKACYFACLEVKGEYIARIDGDDICMPNRLQRQVEFLNTHPDHVVVSSSVIYIDENGDTLGRSFPWTWHSCHKKRRSIVNPGSMYRTAAYRKTCGYVGVCCGEDVVLWSKLIKVGKFSNIKEPLLKYRLLSTSLSRNFDLNGPYAKMLNIMYKKMADDEVVSEEDIALHRTIYNRAKQKRDSVKYDYTPSIEERMQKFLKPILGENISVSFIIFLKNLYVFFYK